MGDEPCSRGELVSVWGDSEGLGLMNIMINGA